MTKGKIFIMHQNMKKCFEFIIFFYKLKHMQTLVTKPDKLSSNYKKNLTHFRRKIFMFDLEMMSDFTDPITSLQKHNNVWKNIKQTYCLDHKRGNKENKRILAFLFPIFLWFNIHPSIFTVMYNLILSFGCYRENSFTVNLYGIHW